MAVIKLKAGETVLVAAIDPSLGIGGGPIVPPDLGLGIPTHPIVLPPDPSDPIPSHPIVVPPGGVPSHPIAQPPGVPTHPIAQPPGTPTHPIFIPVEPTHPIVLPPPGEIPPPIEPGTTPGWEVKIAWTPVTGWVVVAVPTDAHVTPSKRK